MARTAYDDRSAQQKFEDDFNWQKGLESQIINIISGLPVRLFTAAMIAPLEKDLKLNADLCIVPFGGRDIAMRVRRPGYFSNYAFDFTIRSERDTGAETELAKIRRGLGDWYFYGHAEPGWSDD